MKKDLSEQSIIRITSGSTEEIDRFLKRDYAREHKSQERFDKRRRPINADDLVKQEDRENPNAPVPYYPRDSEQRVYDILPQSSKDSSIAKPYRVFLWNTKADPKKYKSGELWSEIEVVDNPMAEIDDILSEPAYDANKMKVVMVVFGTTTIDVYIVHPQDKQGSLEAYRDKVWMLSEEETLEKNREGLIETYGKNFPRFLELVLESTEQLKAGKVSRVIGVSFPTAQKMITDHQKRVESVKRRIKKDKG